MSEQEVTETRDFWDRVAADWKIQVGSEGDRNRRLNSDPVLWDFAGEVADLAVLDAGCGTGTLAFEAAERGAEVVAVDLSPTLVELARERLRDSGRALDVTFLVGDMRDMDLGCFDYAVAMDSLIHYDVTDGVQTLESMAEQINRKMVFTFAPKTPLLTLMHATGRLFPRSDRAPSIEPVSPRKLSGHLHQAGLMSTWMAGRSHRIDVGFYKSHAMELTRR